MVGVHQECPIRLYITFRKRSQWAMKVIVVYIYLLSTSHLMGQWHEQLLGELCWVAVWWLRRRSVDTAGHSIFRESEFSFFMAPRIVLERKTEDDGWRNRDVKDVIGMKWPQSLDQMAIPLKRSFYHEIGDTWFKSWALNDMTGGWTRFYFIGIRLIRSWLQ